VSDTLERVIELVNGGDVRVSDHAYDELAADGIFVRDLVQGVGEAKLLEDYPDFPKGSCALVLEADRDGKPIHVVWGIPKGESRPAVLVTAYRPDPARWTEDFVRRRK